MYQIILLAHVLICMVLVGLILVQHGKGADIGATFGMGASQTLFGSAGSKSFLMKITGLLGAAFFATSLLLGYLAGYSVKHKEQLNVPMTAAPASTAVSPSEVSAEPSKGSLPQ